MASESKGDLTRIYRYSEGIARSRGRIRMMFYTEQSTGTTIDKRRSNRMANIRMRLNRLTLMRRDEILRVYSNATLSRNISPLPQRRRRSRKSRKTSKSVQPRPATAHQQRQLSSSSSSLTSSTSRGPVARSPSPITPLKVTHIVIDPKTTKIEMVPSSFTADIETDEDKEDNEEEIDIIYPEGVTDFRPYKTVARYRKAIGESTDFRAEPLLVDDKSTETLILGLESFAQQHGCDLTFTNENQQFDKSIYRATCGLVDLGSIHLLATDSLLTANFQFEIDLDYDDDITQSKENIEHFVLDFCEAISKVLSCENSNVRVFSIDKLAKKSRSSRVNFGLTTSNQKQTEQLAHELQTRARSGFSNEKILKHIKPGEYEYTWKPVLTHLQIQPSDLDPAHNFDYRKPGVITEDTRGSYPYYLPIGWYRHGLSVSTKYGNDVTWIGHTDAKGEWPVAFHGTKKEAVSGIVKDGFLISAVKTDVKKAEAIGQIGEEANRPGLYVATHCTGGSDRYTTPFTVTTFPGKSEQFRIVFQCRVQPGKFSTHTSPVNVGEAWRIVDPAAVRPYGILLKKES